jgi:hypothetical protein
MQAAYLNALFLAPPVILGRQLKPYSLAHIAFLRSIDSPFYTGKHASINDLVIAAFVCSHAWPFPFMSQDPDALGQACAEWGESLGTVDFKSNLAAFLRYIRAYSAMPARGTPPDAEAIVPEQVPWMFAMAFFLMNDLGFEEIQAWNTPVGRAFAYAAVKAVRSGDETLVSEEEESIAEMLASGMTMDQIAEKLDRPSPVESEDLSGVAPVAKTGLPQQPAAPRKQKGQRHQAHKGPRRHANPGGQNIAKTTRGKQAHNQKTQRRRPNPGNPKLGNSFHEANVVRRSARRKNKTMGS